MLYKTLSVNQSLVGLAGSEVLSTDFHTPDAAANGGSYDINDLRRGPLPQLVVQVTKSVASTGTIRVLFMQADDADIQVNPEIIWSTGPLSQDTLVAGFEFRFPGPPPGQIRPYLRMKYLIEGGDVTDGEITAGFEQA